MNDGDENLDATMATPCKPKGRKLESEKRKPMESPFSSVTPSQRRPLKQVRNFLEGDANLEETVIEQPTLDTTADFHFNQSDVEDKHSECSGDGLVEFDKTMDLNASTDTLEEVAVNVENSAQKNYQTSDALNITVDALQDVVDYVITNVENVEKVVDQEGSPMNKLEDVNPEPGKVLELENFKTEFDTSFEITLNNTQDDVSEKNSSSECDESLSEADKTIDANWNTPVSENHVSDEKHAKVEGATTPVSNCSTGSTRRNIKSRASSRGVDISPIRGGEPLPIAVLPSYLASDMFDVPDNPKMSESHFSFLEHEVEIQREMDLQHAAEIKRLSDELKKANERKEDESKTDRDALILENARLLAQLEEKSTALDNAVRDRDGFEYMITLNEQRNKGRINDFQKQNIELANELDECRQKLAMAEDLDGALDRKRHEKELCDKNDAACREISQLKSSLENLQKAIELDEQKYSLLQAADKEKDAELSAVRAELINLRASKIEALEAEILEHSQKLSASEESRQLLQDAVDLASLEKKALESSLAEIVKAKSDGESEMQLKIDMLTKEIEAVSGLLEKEKESAASTLIEALESKILEHSEKLSASEESRRLLQDAIEFATLEKKTVEDNLGELEKSTAANEIEMHTKITMLTKEIDAVAMLLEKEKETAASSLISSQEEVQKVRSEMENYMAEMETLNDVLQQEKEKSGSMAKAMLELNQTLESKSKENIELANKLDECRQKLAMAEDLDGALDRKRHEKELCDKNDAACREISQLKSNLENLQKAIELDEEKYALLQAAEKEKDAELSAVRAELINLRDSKIEALEAEILEHSEKLSASEESRQLLQDAVDLASLEKKALESSLAELEKSTAANEIEMHTKITMLTKEIDAVAMLLEKEKETAASSLISSQEEVQKVRSEMENYMAEMETLNDVLQQEKEKSGSMAKAMLELNQTLESKSKENIELANKLDECRQKLAMAEDLDGALDRKRHEKELCDKNDAACREISQLKSNLENLQKAIELDEEKYALLQAAEKEKDAELSAVRAELINLRASKIEALEAEILEHSEKLSASEESRQLLQDAVDLASLEKKALESSLAELEKSTAANEIEMHTKITMLTKEIDAVAVLLEKEKETAASSLISSQEEVQEIRREMENYMAEKDTLNDILQQEKEKSGSMAQAMLELSETLESKSKELERLEIMCDKFDDEELAYRLQIADLLQKLKKNDDDDSPGLLAALRQNQAPLEVSTVSVGDPVVEEADAAFESAPSSPTKDVTMMSPSVSAPNETMGASFRRHNRSTAADSPGNRSKCAQQ